MDATQAILPALCPRWAESNVCIQRHNPRCTCGRHPREQRRFFAHSFGGEDAEVSLLYKLMRGGQGCGAVGTVVVHHKDVHLEFLLGQIVQHVPQLL